MEGVVQELEQGRKIDRKRSLELSFNVLNNIFLFHLFCAYPYLISGLVMWREISLFYGREGSSPSDGLEEIIFIYFLELYICLCQLKKMYALNCVHEPILLSFQFFKD